MRHSFKTISEASEIKAHCPFCEKELELTFTTSQVTGDNKAVIYSELDILKLIINGGESTSVEVTMTMKSNDFDYVVKTNNDLVESLDSVGSWLNLAYPSFHKECFTCKYIVSFSSIRFDLSLKKIYGIKLFSEQWIHGEYKVYNEYVTNTCYIYKVTPEEYKVITSLPKQELLTREAALASTNWLKNIITFS